jgi:hypothetical protein
MNIFVSSLIQEFRTERKRAIEAIYYSNHKPIFYENQLLELEPVNLMDDMLNKSDAFLMIYEKDHSGDSKWYLMNALEKENDLFGKWLQKYDNECSQPIKYELLRFHKTHEELSCPSLILLKNPHEEPSLKTFKKDELLGLFLSQARVEFNIRVIPFSKPEDIFRIIKNWTSDLSISEKRKGKRIEHYFIVHYEGIDFRGLIYLLTEVLYFKFLFNLEYITDSSSSGRASLFMDCSSYKNFDEDSLQVDICGKFEEGLKKIGKELERKQWNIEVYKRKESEHRYKFYFSCRTINTYGQLYSITKEFTDSKFNIQDIELHPSEKEHINTNILTIWAILEKPGAINDYNVARTEMLMMESKLRRKNGVLSVKSHLYTRNASNVYLYTVNT